MPSLPVNTATRHLLITVPGLPARTGFWVDLGQPNTLEQLAGTVHVCLTLAGASSRACPAKDEACGEPEYSAAQGAYAEFVHKWTDANKPTRAAMVGSLLEQAQAHLELHQAASFLKSHVLEVSDA